MRPPVTALQLTEAPFRRLQAGVLRSQRVLRRSTEALEGDPRCWPHPVSQAEGIGHETHARRPHHADGASRQGRLERRQAAAAVGRSRRLRRRAARGVREQAASLHVAPGLLDECHEDASGGPAQEKHRARTRICAQVHARRGRYSFFTTRSRLRNSLTHSGCDARRRGSFSGEP